MYVLTSEQEKIIISMEPNYWYPQEHIMSDDDFAWIFAQGLIRIYGDLGAQFDVSLTVEGITLRGFILAEKSVYN